MTNLSRVLLFIEIPASLQEMVLHPAQAPIRASNSAPVPVPRDPVFQKLFSSTKPEVAFRSSVVNVTGLKAATYSFISTSIAEALKKAHE
jgi:hypothetical protein